MKITRGNTFELFRRMWCLKCGKTTEWEDIRGIFPIGKCKICGEGYMLNVNEDGNQILEIDDSSILPEDIFPIGKDVEAYTENDREYLIEHDI